MKTWEVQQAQNIEKYPVAEGEKFWLTQKLNGVRATYYRGKMIGRNGTEIKGLDHITALLNQIPDMVFDGELTLADKGTLSDNEAFRQAAGIVRSKAAEKKEIGFTVFDLIPLGDFEREEPQIPYGERRRMMDTMISKGVCESGYVSVLPVLYFGTDTEVIDGYLNQMVQEDKEGLMLNKDVPYRKTRHSGILKIKRFYTMDLPILRCEEGEGRCEGMLGKLIVDFKGNEVGVGTGFTAEQREELWDNRYSLTGVLAEVKYKEISCDKKTGRESLQFPVFVGLRRDKKEVSYA